MTTFPLPRRDRRLAVRWIVPPAEVSAKPSAPAPADRRISKPTPAGGRARHRTDRAGRPGGAGVPDAPDMSAKAILERARRTRVITGRGTYCVTERSTNTRIDTIEKHGKIWKSNCPKHESPAHAQEWRTARDP